MRIEEIVKNDNVQAFLRNYKKVLETRSLTGVELTIPEEFLGVIRENIENYSKLYKYVTVRTVKGHGRLAVTGAIPEAVWTDACAVLDELDISMTGVDVAAWKVGGYVTVCNATIEDSDVDLVKEILEVLGDAIGYALDRVIVYGNGYREPLGAATELNVTTVTGTGAQLLQGLILAAGSARSQYSTGKKIWLMNATTLDALRAQSIYAAGTGIIGGILDSIETLDFIPDGEIVVGYFDLYLLADRGEIKFATSKDAEFTKDRTLLKAAGRYDGTPIIKTAFARIYMDITDVPTPGGSPEPITITENGTYRRTDGYSPVTVNVKQGKVRTTYYNGDVTVTDGTASIRFDKIMGNDHDEVAGVLKLNGKEYAFWRKKLNNQQNTFRSDSTITMTPVFVDDGDDFVGLSLSDLPLADGTYAALVTDTPDQPFSAMTYKANGTHTVLDEGLVIVDVPEPTGSQTYTKNGTYDVKDIAEAVVDVQSTGGDTLGELLAGTLTEYTNADITELHGYDLAGAHGVQLFSFPNVTRIGKNWNDRYATGYTFYDCDGDINLPNVHGMRGSHNFEKSKITAVHWDNIGIGEPQRLILNEDFSECTALKTVYIKGTDEQTLMEHVTAISAGYHAFNKCTNLEKCEIRSPYVGDQLNTEIGSSSFYGCTKLSVLILDTYGTGAQVYRLSNVNAFKNTPIESGTGYVYVTDALVDTYKAATNWSTFADQIKPLSEYTESE